MRTCRGITLVELVIALGLASLVCASAATALLMARAIAGHARDQAIGLATAGAGLEAALAAAATLPPAPADSLSADRPGYVDYLDETGRGIGAEPAQRAQAAYVRRWWLRRDDTGTGELAVAAVVVAPAGLADRLGVVDARWAPPPGVIVRRGARLRTAS